MGLVGCTVGAAIACPPAVVVQGVGRYTVLLATAFRWASCGSSLRPYATLSYYRSLPCFCCFSLAITTWFSSDSEFLALLAVGSLSQLPAFSLVVGNYLRLCLLLASASLAPLRFFALVLRLLSCFWMVLWCGHAVPPFPSCDLDSVSIHWFSGCTSVGWCHSWLPISVTFFSFFLEYIGHGYGCHTLVLEFFRYIPPFPWP